MFFFPQLMFFTNKYARENISKCHSEDVSFSLIVAQELTEVNPIDVDECLCGTALIAIEVLQNIYFNEYIINKYNFFKILTSYTFSLHQKLFC